MLVVSLFLAKGFCSWSNDLNRIELYCEQKRHVFCVETLVVINTQVSKSTAVFAAALPQVIVGFAPPNRFLRLQLAFKFSESGN